MPLNLNVFNRAKRLFSFRDLESGASESSSLRNNSLANVKVSATTTGGTVTIEQHDSTPNPNYVRSRFQKKLMIIITGICLLASIIIISFTVNRRQYIHDTVLTSKGSETLEEKALQAISLDDITGKLKFYPDYFDGTWINDHEILISGKSDKLAILDARTQRKKWILSSKTLNERDRPSHLSKDLKYLLIERNYHPLYRASYYAEYRILDLEGRTISYLKPANATSPFWCRYVSWAPKGNGLAYVDINNNIYYRSSALAQDNLLTRSGKRDVIFNGVPDWVFEEEIIEDNSALWWSPDGSKLVWGSFDDTSVNTMFLKSYGILSEDPKSIPQYPLITKSLHYPKVGTTNPVVTLWLADLNDGDEIRVKELPPPTSFAGLETHFSKVTWANSESVAINWMNRVQNRSILSYCRVSDLDCKEIFEINQPDGWIENSYQAHFNPKPLNSDFLLILSDTSTASRFRQIFRIYKGKQFRLTNAEADVAKIIKWTDKGFVYYTSTLPNRSTSRHLFRIYISPTFTIEEKLIPECLSCNNTEMEYLGRDPCGFVEVEMSSKGSFYFMKCQGPGIPWASLYQANSLRFISNLEDNSDLEQTTQDFAMPTVKFLNIPVPGSNQKANVKLILPATFDPKSDKKLPLLVEVYGGPGFLKVHEKWNYYEYYSYLVGSYDIAYAIIDPRGSGYQGDTWKFALYRNLGKIESEDVITITKHLKSELDYIDSERTAVWGWSYGGFLTLKVLTNDDESVFDCGASVAPVVDWTLYDTYYTERFMGLPNNDNERGYNESRVIWNLDRLREKKYYLLHGTNDDNVHFQQSLVLSAALEEKDILFRQQAYPDQNHGIPRYRKHLYHSITEFFIDECFGMGLE